MQKPLRQEEAVIDTPVVSVVAVCYNHARFVTACLDSIKNQTFKSLELIIVDDCSSDNSVCLINEWVARSGIHVIFIEHKTNLGLCRTLNEALTYVRGRFVSFVATDDIYFSGKIERQLDLFEELDDTFAISYGDMMMIDEDGRPLPGLMLDWVRAKYGTPPSGKLLDVLLDTNVITAPTVMFRSEVFKVVGGFDEGLSYEDYDMWLRIAQRYNIAYCDAVLAQYRIVSTSMQRTLLAPSSYKGYQNNARILLKCLDAVPMEAALRQSVINKAAHHAESAYRLRGDEAGRLLWDIFLRTRNLRYFFLFLGAAARAPYSFVVKLVSCAKWRI